jgi:NAD(P)-dependent dehydrogenase (short-subunit alcohol dehydrogenase family)
MLKLLSNNFYHLSGGSVPRPSLERLGTPEDVATLAVFLLSPEADSITGQTISVDGDVPHFGPKAEKTRTPSTRR